MQTSSKMLMLYRVLHRQPQRERATFSKILMLYELLNCLPPKTRNFSGENVEKIRSARRRALFYDISKKCQCLTSLVYNSIIHKKENPITPSQVASVLEKLLVCFLKKNENIISEDEKAKCILNCIKEAMALCKNLQFHDIDSGRNFISGLMESDLTWWRLIFLLALILRQAESESTKDKTSDDYKKKITDYLESQDGWEKLNKEFEVHQILNKNYFKDLRCLLQKIALLTIFFLIKA